MSENANLPAEAVAGGSLSHLVNGPMSPALAIMLDPLMFERAKQLATGHFYARATPLGLRVREVVEREAGR